MGIQAAEADLAQELATGDAPPGFPAAPVSTVPMPGTTGTNPVVGLDLSGPSDIGPAQARTILQGMGLLTAKTRLSTALAALTFTHTYNRPKKKQPPTDNVTLTPQQQQWLFQDYTELK